MFCIFHPPPVLTAWDEDREPGLLFSHICIIFFSAAKRDKCAGAVSLHRLSIYLFLLWTQQPKYTYLCVI